jgi:hypothetical protein
LRIGGKAKPLKAPKKAPKAELDDEDKAFQEKQKAGESSVLSNTPLLLIQVQMRKPRLRWPQKPKAAKALSTLDHKESRRVERNK